MNELEILHKELQEINNKQVRLQTIIDQAKQQCKDIEEKYNIKNEQELKSLLDAATNEYMNKVNEATIYLADAKAKLLPFEEML